MRRVTRQAVGAALFRRTSQQLHGAVVSTLSSSVMPVSSPLASSLDANDASSSASNFASAVGSAQGREWFGLGSSAVMADGCRCCKADGEAIATAGMGRQS